MLEKDDGIVLRAARSGETSLLLTFLGRRSGKVRLMAKGALGSKHPARGALAPGNHLEVVYYFKEGRSLFYLKDTSLLVAATAERDSLPHMAVSLAVLELLDHVCYASATDPAIVDLAIAFVSAPRAADPLLFFLAFEWQLLCALGAGPDLWHCSQCGKVLETGVYSAKAGASFCHSHRGEVGEAIGLSAETLAAAEHCARAELASLAGVTIDPRARKAVGKILHWTYTFHVQGYTLPNSLNLI